MIQDISRRTGLAGSTVAAILRDAPGFNVNTRQRVMDIARDLGYRPNFLGKALAGGKSMTIGVLGCWLTSPSIAMKLESIETTARQAGYLCYLASPEFENTSAQLSHLQGLIDRRVDGLILDYIVVPPARPVQTLLKKSGVPHVFMDWAPPKATNRVAVVRETGIAECADHLTQLGHRDVVYVTTQYDIDHPQYKIDLYRRHLARGGATMPADNLWAIGTDVRQVIDAAYDTVTRKLRNLSPQKYPTAMIFSGDHTAMAGLKAIRDLGLRVPEDISVVGFDNLPLTAMTTPPLTTIHQPRANVGERAFAMLHSLMSNPQADVHPLDLHCSLVIRESTGPARY
jgi:LacI family transcriptional regulator